MPSAQAGHEKTLTALPSVLAGTSTVYGAGMLELGMSFSLEQLVIDNDIIGMIKHVANGIKVDDETIGYNLIKKAGIGGDFIGFKETFDGMKYASHPRTIDRQMRVDWEKEGSKNDVDLAHDVVLDILANHEVDPIKHRNLVDKVIKDADERYRKIGI